MIAVPEVDTAVRSAAKTFESLGAQISSLVVPKFSEFHLLTERYVINAAETHVHDAKLIETHNDEIDLADQRILRFAVFQVLKVCDGDFVNFASLLFHPNMSARDH